MARSRKEGKSKKGRKMMKGGATQITIKIGEKEITGDLTYSAYFPDGTFVSDKSYNASFKVGDKTYNVVTSDNISKDNATLQFLDEINKPDGSTINDKYSIIKQPSAAPAAGTPAAGTPADGTPAAGTLAAPPAPTSVGGKRKSKKSTKKSKKSKKSKSQKKSKK
jgi:hypothetical protein